MCILCSNEKSKCLLADPQPPSYQLAQGPYGGGVKSYELVHVAYVLGVTSYELAHVASGGGVKSYELVQGPYGGERVAWIFYGVGVTLSRMSVSCGVELRRLWVLSALQAANLALWTAEATTHAVRGLGDVGYWLLLLWMVWVGVMGGAAYINSMQLMNKSAAVPDELRELGTNVCFVLINVGIMSSTLLFVVLDSTVLSLERLYPNASDAGG